MAECIVYGSVLAEDGWSISNLIALGSILVDLLIAVYITIVVNRRLSSDREIRNYFIKEVEREKDLHNIFWEDFENSAMKLQDVLSWFKRRNMESAALMNAYCEKKRKVTSRLDTYVQKMRNFIDETDWMKNPQRNGHHKISAQDKRDIIRFKTENALVFHKLISDING